MRILGIPVKIGNESLFVTYVYEYDKKNGGRHIIMAEGKTLIVDELFNIISNKMPDKWIRPIINGLKQQLDISESRLAILSDLMTKYQETLKGKDIEKMLDAGQAYYSLYRKGDLLVEDRQAIQEDILKALLKDA